uniref:Uncharacterized protein n=1 Tax=Opuntia streptacantha TaxID=393608 RepID=A0A7C9DDA1_OPUST
METGKFTLSNGEIVPIEDAIVIFSCDSFNFASRACSPSLMQKLEEANDHQEERELSNKLDDVEEASSSLPLDLNMAVDDGNDNDNHTVGDIRILEAVDKQAFFSIQVL